MHKGYAFVQFLNPLDARNACIGEDSRNIMNQVLGMNLLLFFFFEIIIRVLLQYLFGNMQSGDLLSKVLTLTQ